MLDGSLSRSGNPIESGQRDQCHPHSQAHPSAMKQLYIQPIQRLIFRFLSFNFFGVFLSQLADSGSTKKKVGRIVLTQRCQRSENV